MASSSRATALALDVELVLLQALANPAAGFLGRLERAAVDQRRVLPQQLDQAAIGVERAGHEHQRRHRFGLSRCRPRALRPGNRARPSASVRPPPARASARPRRPCAAWVRAGAPPRGPGRPAAAPSSAGSGRRPGSRRSSVAGAGGGRFVGVEALDVEGLEALVDQRQRTPARDRGATAGRRLRAGRAARSPAAIWARTSAGFIDSSRRSTDARCHQPELPELCRFPSDQRAFGDHASEPRG